MPPTPPTSRNEKIRSSSPAYRSSPHATTWRRVDARLRLLHGSDVPDLGEPGDRPALRHDDPRRDVVEDDRPVGRRGNRRDVRDDARAAAAVVVRRDDEEPVDPDVVRPLRVDRVGRRVRPGPGDHGAAVADRVDGGLVERKTLLVVERRRLPRRPRHHDAVGAVVEQMRAERAERVEVDRPVRAERRHDRGQDLAEHRRDCTRLQARQEKPFEAHGQARREAPHCLDRAQHARHESRAEVVSPDREAPGPPRITSWCATRPGRRTEWMATSPAIRSVVARAVPDGASRFVSACSSSTISARGNDAEASSAKRIISTAPSAKFGAKKQDARLARHPVELGDVEPGRAHHQRHAPGQTALGVPEHRFRAGEVHRDVAPSGPAARPSATSWPAATSVGPSIAPTLPWAPNRQTFTRAPRARGSPVPRRRGSEPRVPDPAAERRSGANSVAPRPRRPHWSPPARAGSSPRSRRARCR